jgi:hypothetical protein
MIKYLIGAIVGALLVGVGGWVYLNYFGGWEYGISKREATLVSQGEWPPLPAPLKPIEKIDWVIEEANSGTTDPNDPKKYQQSISMNLVFTDTTNHLYYIGKEYGCSVAGAARSASLESGQKLLSTLSCGVESGTLFVVYTEQGELVVEKQVESLRDGAISKTVVQEINMFR